MCALQKLHWLLSTPCCQDQLRPQMDGLVRRLLRGNIFSCYRARKRIRHQNIKRPMTALDVLLGLVRIAQRLSPTSPVWPGTSGSARAHARWGVLIVGNSFTDWINSKNMCFVYTISLSAVNDYWNTLGASASKEISRIICDEIWIDKCTWVFGLMVDLVACLSLLKFLNRHIYLTTWTGAQC